MLVKIIADSTCDLPRDIIEELDIDIIPLYVIMDDVSYKDGLEMTPEKLIEWSDKTKEPPQTSAPTIDDYTNLFKSYIDKKQDVVFVSVTSALSSTMQNAFFAANALEPGNIRVVDGKNVSMGTGLIVVKAAQWAKEGKSADEIVEAVEEYLPKVRSSFVFDNLEFLKRGGRCTAAKALAASALSIRPRIDTIDGLLIPVDKFRGSLSKVVIKFCDSVFKDIEEADPEMCIIGKTTDDNRLIDIILEEVEKKNYFKKIIKADAGCIMTSHSGPNTFAIAFAKK